MVRREDRRPNALPTDRPTNQPMDTASYRGALSHLKKNIHPYSCLAIPLTLSYIIRPSVVLLKHNSKTDQA